MSKISNTFYADVRHDIERLSTDLVRKASVYPAAILADVAGRRGALDGRIAPVAGSMRVAGPAFTVEVRPGDNLMIHAAIAMAQPGDVLVIDGKADRTCALMGAIMINTCKQRGLAGVVIDAAIRDVDELRALGFPVFAVGANPNGPTKSVSGRINWPVSCGGVAVTPGDLVVGDADGVVIVEREKVAPLLDLFAKKVSSEEVRLAEIATGKNLRPGWLDAALKAAGVELGDAAP